MANRYLTDEEWDELYGDVLGEGSEFDPDSGLMEDWGSWYDPAGALMGYAPTEDDMIMDAGYDPYLQGSLSAAPGALDKKGNPEPWDIDVANKQNTFLYKQAQNIFNPEMALMQAILSGQPLFDYAQTAAGGAGGRAAAPVSTPYLDMYTDDPTYGFIAENIRNNQPPGAIRAQIREEAKKGTFSLDEAEELIKEIPTMVKEKAAAETAKLETSTKLSPMDEMLADAGLPSMTEQYSEENVELPDYYGEYSQQGLDELAKAQKDLDDFEFSYEPSASAAQANRYLKTGQGATIKAAESPAAALGKFTPVSHTFGGRTGVTTPSVEGGSQLDEVPISQLSDMAQIERRQRLGQLGTVDMSGTPNTRRLGRGTQYQGSRHPAPGMVTEVMGVGIGANEKGQEMTKRRKLVDAIAAGNIRREQEARKLEAYIRNRQGRTPLNDAIRGRMTASQGMYGGQ